MRFGKLKLTTFAMLCGIANVFATYWPENYGGVMLQGFYWESYTETSWEELMKQSDDIATYFDLMWVPNSARCTDVRYSIDKKNTNNMGYMPLYWWNHNSAFGTERELLEMISVFKQKGVGVIADVVINHRNGMTCWTDFPTETDKKGTQWVWDVNVICKDDEVNTDPNAAGQKRATGNNDTGAKVSYCRDLDHTNIQLQDGIKAYTRDLLNYYGYSGFRYDMTSGYASSYTKMYNENVKPDFSVGEYWVSSSTAPTSVVSWIDGTGKTSAAFDFPTKFEINKAFNNNNFSSFVTTKDDQTIPNGVKGLTDYCRYAVTFVENHDTYKDSNKMKGDVVAANAYILTHPGTPCVFWVHWKNYHDEIARLIQIRKAVGVTNQSVATVLETSNTRYAAKVKGNNGELVICLGDCNGFAPEGYSDENVVASNDKYKIWTKSKIPALAAKRVYEENVSIAISADKLSVESPKSIKDIVLFNVSAAKVKTVQDNNEISLADIPNGTYFYMITFVEGTINVGKIVK